MKIVRRRIKKPELYLGGIEKGESFYIAFNNVEQKLVRLFEAGFSNELNVGEKVLPAVVGRISRYNAEGSFKIIKDLPKEQLTREVLWTWKDWQDNEHSKIVDVPYERYQRELIPAPSDELTIQSRDDEKLIVSRKLVNLDESYGSIKHLINLFLELFGECEIVREDFASIIKAPIVNLNWRILPPGKYPYQRLKGEVKEIVDHAKEGKRPIIAYRMQMLSGHNPEFVAIGQAGFRGYVVFGFPQRNLFILESFIEGNATYLLNDNWEQVSNLTKAEILNQNLHRERYIHRDGWQHQVNRLFA